MSPRILSPRLLVAAALLLLPATGPAQEAEQLAGFTVASQPGQTRLAIAVPKPVGGAAESAEFYEVLARDLELCGWFTVLRPEAYIEPNGTGVAPGQFKYEDWDVVGAAVLGKTTLTNNGGRLTSEVWVYDVPGRRKLDARSFSGAATSSRVLAHKAANAIIFAVTGKQGPFNTRFAVAGAFGKNRNKEIYTVDFDGHGLSAVTKNGSINLQPAWDPTASRIAFTSYLSGNPDLYIADLGKGRITRVSARSGLNTGGSFSPRGGLLAITLSPGGDPDLFTIDPTTGAEVGRLTRSPGIDVSASWSPDGSQFAFVSDRTGSAQIYIANADGSGARRVSFQGGQNTDPAWSPDGSKIAYVSRDGGFDIFTVNVDGTGVTRITQSKGDNEDPSWSPDGYYIAFSSTRTGSAHIWMSTADGAYQVQLTKGGGGYTNPVWSPALAW